MSRVFRLEGHVLDEDERPVTDARVWLRESRTALTTAADGTFVFDAVPARPDSVAATKGDLYASPTLVGPEDAADRLMLRMRVGTTLIVHAFAERAPVVGATLVLGDGITAMTDAHGAAIVRGLRPGLQRAWLFAEGLAAEQLVLSLQEDPGGIVETYLALRGGSRVDGVVVGILGRPVTDAVVRLWTDGGGTAYEAPAGVDGTWHVHVRAGSYRLWAYSKRDGGTRPVSLVCDGRTPNRGITLRAAPLASVARFVRAAARRLDRGTAKNVRGVVVDVHGRPACDAFVQVARASGSQVWGGHADAGGRFATRDLRSGEYDVVARWNSPHSPQIASSRQRVRPGDTGIRVVLAPGASVTGRVLLDGAPVPYYGVALTEPDVHGGTPLGVRARDGRFAIPHVEPGTWQIAVIAPGTRRKVVGGITIVGEESVDVGDVALERGWRVSGRVRDAAGAPLAGARVIVGYWTDLQVEQRSRLEQWFMGRFETATDAEGAYVFDGIHAHQTMIPPRIWATHHRAGASVIRELPDEDATIDFTLQGAGAIAGIVEGVRGGETMANAILAGEPRGARAAFADDGGRFQFEDMPPGDYVITLAEPLSEQVPRVNVTVVADQTATVRLVIADASVQLTLTVPAGRGSDLVIEPVSLGAGIGGLVRGILASSTEDRCTFDFVRPGDYRVSLDGKTWTPITVAASPPEQSIDLHTGNQPAAHHET